MKLGHFFFYVIKVIFWGKKLNKFTWKVAGMEPSSAANMESYIAAVARAVSLFRIWCIDEHNEFPKSIDFLL